MAHVWMNFDGELNILRKGTCFHRVGSKSSGKILDGEEWDQCPDTFKPSLSPGEYDTDDDYEEMHDDPNYEKYPNDHIGPR